MSLERLLGYLNQEDLDEKDTYSAQAREMHTEFKLEIAKRRENL
jgi:hypothetical protein